MIVNTASAMYSVACIELSSDEDEATSEVGNPYDTKSLLESFLFKVSQEKVSVESLNFTRRLYQNSPSDFRNSKDFFEFLTAVKSWSDETNAVKAVTKVCQTLCSENIPKDFNSFCSSPVKGTPTVQTQSSIKEEKDENRIISTLQEADEWEKEEPYRIANDTSRNVEPSFTKGEGKSDGGATTNDKCMSPSDGDDLEIVAVVKTPAKRPGRPKAERKSGTTTAENTSKKDLLAIQKDKKRSRKKLAQKELARKKKIAKLKTLLEAYRAEIKNLSTAELSLAEMEFEDSSYIREGKLKEKCYNIIKRLEELEGEDYVEDRKKHIHVASSQFLEINRAVEEFVNSKDRFPDVFDVRNIVRKVNMNFDLGLRPSEQHQVTVDIFSEVGNRIQRRRKREFRKYTEHYYEEQDEDDPASYDMDLRRKLKQNKKIAKANTNKVFRTYAQIQFDQSQGHHSSDDECMQTVLNHASQITPKVRKSTSGQLPRKSRGKKSADKTPIPKKPKRQSYTTLQTINTDDGDIVVVEPSPEIADNITPVTPFVDKIPDPPTNQVNPNSSIPSNNNTSTGQGDKTSKRSSVGTVASISIDGTEDVPPESSLSPKEALIIHKDTEQSRKLANTLKSLNSIVDNLRKVVASTTSETTSVHSVASIKNMTSSIPTSSVAPSTASVENSTLSGTTLSASKEVTVTVPPLICDSNPAVGTSSSTGISSQHLLKELISPRVVSATPLAVTTVTSLRVPVTVPLTLVSSQPKASLASSRHVASDSLLLQTGKGTLFTTRQQQTGPAMLPCPPRNTAPLMLAPVTIPASINLARPPVTRVLNNVTMPNPRLPVIEGQPISMDKTGPLNGSFTAPSTEFRQVPRSTQNPASNPKISQLTNSAKTTSVSNKDDIKVIDLTESEPSKVCHRPLQDDQTRRNADKVPQENSSGKFSSATSAAKRGVYGVTSIKIPTVMVTKVSHKNGLTIQQTSAVTQRSIDNSNNSGQLVHTMPNLGYTKSNQPTISMNKVVPPPVQSRPSATVPNLGYTKSSQPSISVNKVVPPPMQSRPSGTVPNLGYIQPNQPTISMNKVVPVSMQSRPSGTVPNLGYTKPNQPTISMNKVVPVSMQSRPSGTVPNSSYTKSNQPTISVDKMLPASMQCGPSGTLPHSHAGKTILLGPERLPLPSVHMQRVPVARELTASAVSTQNVPRSTNIQSHQPQLPVIASVSSLAKASYPPVHHNSISGVRNELKKSPPDRPSNSDSRLPNQERVRCNGMVKVSKSSPGKPNPDVVISSVASLRNNKNGVDAGRSPQFKTWTPLSAVMNAMSENQKIQTSQKPQIKAVWSQITKASDYHVQQQFISNGPSTKTGDSANRKRELVADSGIPKSTKYPRTVIPTNVTGQSGISINSSVANRINDQVSSTVGRHTEQTLQPRTESSPLRNKNNAINQTKQSVPINQTKQSVPINQTKQSAPGACHAKAGSSTTHPCTRCGTTLYPVIIRKRKSVVPPVIQIDSDDD